MAVLKTGKRFLFLFHRWSGVFLSVLFGLWFASGFVMMYVGYPELTEEEYFTGLPPLPSEEVRITPAQAFAAAGVTSSAGRVLLATVLSRPAYRILDGQNRWSTVYADNGELFEGLTETTAVQAALDYAPGESVDYGAVVDMDQWTITSSLNNLRPFHKVNLNDGSGTELYISNVTGIVARDTKTYERAWNWLGTTIHWIYPLPLRRHGELWEDIVIYLSLAGTLAALTGVVIGIMRLRLRKRYSRNRITPYSGVQKLHHVLGMVIGAFVLMFIFSGMMSMNPWGVFDSPTSLQAQVEDYHSTELSAEALSPIPDELWDYPPASFELKQIEWRMIGGEEFLILAHSAHERIAVPADRLSSNGVEAAIRKAAPRLIGAANIAATDVLHGHDTWYYSHHDSYRPLPVLRVEFDDPENTWFHIDLSTGAVLNRITDADRVERWLYNGMHSLDFPFLIHNRPLWDIVVLLLSLAGTAFCVTSVIIGWRRLKAAV